MLLHVLPLLVMMGAQAPPPQASPPATVQKPAPAVRKIYNESADAKAQVEAAVKAAAEDGIRVLVNWGANDDENCTKFQQAMYGGTSPDATQQIRRKLTDEYRVVTVDVGHFDKNQDVARAYGGPRAAGGLPHLTILDSTGKVLAQQSQGEAAYAPERLLAFLSKYQAPPPPAADPLFTAALEKGKRENKTVFVWFSAPW